MDTVENKVKETRKLSKKDVFMSYVNWITFSLSCQNMERMMSPAFVRMLGRVADKLYDNEEDKQAMLMRHTQFFNTEEVTGSMIPGIVLGMEEQKACGKDMPEEVITSVKTALMGPFAGVGDALVGGTLRPILLSVALGLAAGGSVVGPLFYCILWFGITSIGSWLLFNAGYKTGISGAE
ncbi:MAG: PTS system mannose/fructose/sorbose family transporter subunit IID, partial [Sporomusa sp.]